ncbi:unnamed protein product [Laminaria digitata]
MFGWWEQKEKEDPCAEAMAAYLRCVEGKADGLREGDECVDEAEAYKKCRQLVKEAKGQGAKTASTGAATADDKKQQPR